MMNGWNGGMTWEGWLFMSLFWVVLLMVIVWAVARLFPNRDERQVAAAGGPALTTTEQPHEILDRRLASGEIDVDTYEKLRKTLSAGEQR